MVEHLLQVGANSSALTESGWSPLHTAAFRGHANVAEVLLSHDEVDASQRDLMGYTPLELAEQEAVSEPGLPWLACILLIFALAIEAGRCFLV